MPNFMDVFRVGLGYLFGGFCGKLGVTLGEFGEARAP